MSLVALCAVAGCASSQEQDPASTSARDFVAAVKSQDGAAACALLTPKAAQSATGATDVKCSEAVLNVDESGDTVGKVEVWGDTAQVHVGDDVVFLRKLAAGWRVQAAGCKPMTSGPYDCTVGG